MVTILKIVVLTRRTEFQNTLLFIIDKHIVYTKMGLTDIISAIISFAFFIFNFVVFVSTELCMLSSYSVCIKCYSGNKIINFYSFLLA